MNGKREHLDSKIIGTTYFVNRIDGWYLEAIDRFSDNKNFIFYLNTKVKGLRDRMKTCLLRNIQYVYTSVDKQLQDLIFVVFLLLQA